MKILLAFCNFCHARIEHAEPQELFPEEQLTAQATRCCVRKDAEITVDAAKCPGYRERTTTATVQWMRHRRIHVLTRRMNQQPDALADALYGLVRCVGSVWLDEHAKELHAAMHLAHLQLAHVQLQA